MAHTHFSGYCPDACSGGHPDRQMVVTDRLINEFPEGTQAKIAVHGEARRCTYCGLVYLLPASQVGSRLGFWDSGVRGQGWTQ